MFRDEVFIQSLPIWLSWTGESSHERLNDNVNKQIAQKFQEVERMTAPLMSVKQLFDPMLCEPVDLEKLQEVAQKGTHIFQPKYDGMRVVAYKGTDRYFILNRKADDVTHRFPEVCESIEKIPPGTLVDGEVCRLDATGKPDFAGVTRRANLDDMNKIIKLAEDEPLTFVAFDLLAISNKMLNGFALEQRVDFLDSLPLTKAESTEDFQALYDRLKNDQWEGLVAKDKTSKYEFGRRSSKWLKHRFQ